MFNVKELVTKVGDFLLGTTTTAADEPPISLLTASKSRGLTAPRKRAHPFPEYDRNTRSRSMRPEPSMSQKEARLLGPQSDFSYSDPDAVAIANPMVQKKEIGFATSKPGISGYGPVNTLGHNPTQNGSTRSSFQRQTLQRGIHTSAQPGYGDASHPSKKVKTDHVRSVDRRPRILQDTRQPRSALKDQSTESATKPGRPLLDQRPSNAGTDAPHNSRFSPGQSPSSHRRIQTADEIESPYFSTKPQTNTFQPVQDEAPITVDDSSDENEKFTENSRRQRNKRSETPRQSKPGGRLSAQSPELERQTVQMPSSPDELQTEPLAHGKILKSPERIGPGSSRHQRNITSLIAGNPKSTQLRPDKAQASEATAVEFALQFLATDRVTPKKDYYVLVVDKTDKTFWINISESALNRHDPVNRPFRVKDIADVEWCSQGAPLVHLRFRGRGVCPAVFQMQSDRASFELVTLLQDLEGNLKVRERDQEHQRKVLYAVGKVASNLRAAANALRESQDDLTLHPQLAQAAIIRETRRLNSKQPEVALQSSRPSNGRTTRETLDGPRNPPTIISGSERRGNSEEIIAESPPTRRERKKVARTPPPASPPPIKFSQTGGLGTPWSNPLAYPPAGKKKAEVNFASLERLDDDEFLNDTLISFFLRYLQHQTEQDQPEILRKVHFFNTFFLESLTQGNKRNGINYGAVQKWTKNINLFSRDYVIIPVNENLHWYAIIICNLSAFDPNRRRSVDVDQGSIGAANGRSENDEQQASVDAAEATAETQQSFEDLNLEDSTTPKKGRKKKRPSLKKYDANEPIIISLDSLGMTRSPTCSLVKHYIIEEARDKLDITIDKTELKAMTGRMIPLQENYSDCGLYLCMYLEQFIKNPDRFVHAILQREEMGWPDEVRGTDLRARMRNLVLDLHREQENEQKQHGAIPELGGVLVTMKARQTAQIPGEDSIILLEPEPEVRRPASQDVQPTAALVANEASPVATSPRKVKINSPAYAASAEAPSSRVNGVPVKKQKVAKPKATQPVVYTIDDGDNEEPSAGAIIAQQQPGLTEGNLAGHVRHAAPQEDQRSGRESSWGGVSCSTDFLTSGAHLRGNVPEQTRQDLMEWDQSPAPEQASPHQRRSQDTTEIPETPDEGELEQEELRAGEDEMIFQGR